MTAQRTCLLVLGMHRSGTSALTRVLNLLGAALPKTVIAPDGSNPLGYWEPARLVAINDAMLEEAGSHWDDPRHFDFASLDPTRLCHYRREIRTAIEEEYGRATTFVLKDPRICRLVPLYTSVLDDLGIKTSCVLIHRSPSAVISSLGRRNRMTPPFAGLLWLRHVLAAEAATRGLARVSISYEALFTDTALTVQRLLPFLPGGAENSPEAMDAVIGWLSDGGQHHPSCDVSPGAIRDLLEQAHASALRLEEVPPTVFDQLRDRLDGATSLLVDAQFCELLSRGRDARDKYRPDRALQEAASTPGRHPRAQDGAAADPAVSEPDLETSVLTAANAALARSLDRLTAEVERQAQAATSAQARLATLVDREAELAGALAASQGEVALLTNARSELEQSHESLRQQTERLQATIEEILASTSWRITTPVRALGTLIGNAATLPGRTRRHAWKNAVRIWHVLPLGHAMKRQLKNALFERFPRLLANTDAYKTWLSQAVPAPVELPAPAAPDQDAPFRAYAEQILSRAGSPGAAVDYVPKLAETIDFSQAQLKTIAFYLPQFHPIPENDEWWGSGFTEWTNVSKAVPQFLGHYQPHLPGELGFYDLRLVDVMRQQAQLARSYGISGFCFHHYWFAGRRLLERPVDQFLAAPDIDISFCLCWANENWTRRWDGADDEVLMHQRYSPRDDVAFIRALAPALRDRRYVRHAGKPVLIVYRASLLPDPSATAQRWRETCASEGIEDLYLVAARTFDVADPRPLGFDAALEFPPHQLPVSRINEQMTVINPAYRGNIYAYEEMADGYARQTSRSYPLIKTVMPSWDNEARRPGRGYTLHGSSPATYGRWFRAAYSATQARVAEDPAHPPLLFVNAWNEWAEGAHLEPDRKYGYAYLHATANAIRDLTPARASVLGLVGESQRSFRKRSDTALVLHLHYDDLFEELADTLAGADADLFISLRKDVPVERCLLIRRRLPNARLAIFPNRGRDIQPFLQTFRLLSELGYELGCKLHAKKSPHRSDGEQLRLDAIEGLAGTTRFARNRGFLASHPDVGLIALDSSILRLDDIDHNFHNREWLSRLFPRIGAPHLADSYACEFVAGSMFWFRVRALAAIDALGLSPDDFEDELGQVDGTLAHAVERLFAAMAAQRGYTTISAEHILSESPVPA